MEKLGQRRKDVKFDLLLSLPKELSLKVLSYLSGKELSTVCKVSKSWRELANCNLLWKKLCIRESMCDINDLISENADDSENYGQDLEPECRWSKIYHEKARLHSNWAADNYTWMSIDQEKPRNTYTSIYSSVDVYNNILAVAYWIDSVPTVDIMNIRSNCFQQLQTISLPFTLDREPIGVSINGSVLAIELSCISVIYNCENGKFVYEILVVPEIKTVCPSGEEQQFVQNYHRYVRCWTLCLAGRYIWYQASSAIIIYDRNTKTFKNMDDILQVVAAEIHGDLIGVQCPQSVRVFSVDGQLLYTYRTHQFYTGLVMSSTSFAFLQSEDFSDPHVVQVELRTWKIYRETKLRVYRVALHKNTIFLLSQDPFSLTSMSDGNVKWSNLIRGTKYLRPGKDFFTVICSRYVFVCPSLARLDVFSLYDVNSGDHLYDTTLTTSSYNIQHVYDSCLVVCSKKSTINIRSYV